MHRPSEPRQGRGLSGRLRPACATPWRARTAGRRGWSNVSPGRAAAGRAWSSGSGRDNEDTTCRGRELARRGHRTGLGDGSLVHHRPGRTTTGPRPRCGGNPVRPAPRRRSADHPRLHPAVADRRHHFGSLPPIGTRPGLDTPAGQLRARTGCPVPPTCGTGHPGHSVVQQPIQGRGRGLLDTHCGTGSPSPAAADGVEVTDTTHCVVRWITPRGRPPRDPSRTTGCR